MCPGPHWCLRTCMLALLVLRCVNLTSASNSPASFCHHRHFMLLTPTKLMQGTRSVFYCVWTWWNIFLIVFVSGDNFSKNGNKTIFKSVCLYLHSSVSDSQCDAKAGSEWKHSSSVDCFHCIFGFLHFILMKQHFESVWCLCLDAFPCETSDTIWFPHWHTSPTQDCSSVIRE